MAENTTTRVVEVQVDNAEAIKLIADYNAKIEESTAKEKALREAIKKKGEATAADREELAGMCRWLSTSPDSVFTQTVFAFRHEEGGVAVLRGRTINFIRPGEKSLRFIDSADEFATILKDRFELDIPGARELWPAVCARHDELFGAVTA